MFSTSLYSDVRTKEARKEFANSLYLSNTFLRPLFVGIREVQEKVSERIEKAPGRYVDGTVKASRVAERGRQRVIGNSVVVCVHVHTSARVRFGFVYQCLCVCVCVGVCVCVRACVCVHVSACVLATFCACVYNLWHLLVLTKR